MDRQSLINSKMRELGYTNQSLADELGVSPKTLINIKKGRVYEDDLIPNLLIKLKMSLDEWLNSKKK